MVPKCCPTHDELLAYTLGRVSLATQATISEHLCDCAPCLKVLADMECEMDPLLSAVTRASHQPSSVEWQGNESVYQEGLTRTLALAREDTMRTAAVQETVSCSRLGQYELLEELGRGGMGVVYRARHLQLERIVALKILHDSRLTSSDAVERFQREMRAVGKLEHPYIVQATDAGQVDGRHYLAMEYVAGETLSSALRRQKRFSAKAACELVQDVARGLQHAHLRGLIHRDIKPSNILLDNKQKARITDFGLALREKDPADDLAYAGTPAYMSPEQARGEGHRVDGRSDIFSLGAVFYRLLTGCQPFEGASIRQLCERIASTEPSRPRTLDSGIPEELERICLKALAKDPARRYETAGEFADDLDSWLQRRDSLDRGIAVSGSELPELVPKGLQAYDAEDARFFPRLVPGQRDQSGLPLTIRFWKRRIEETDPEKAFRVAVLHGPNGGGKTSLVRAGLLPKLAEHVRSIVVVATARHTEEALTARLREYKNSIPHSLGLLETLAEVKDRLAEQPDAKILLVLDQFEQWLHTDRELEKSILVKALQLCDGQRIQCLIVVRDELWQTTTRFMNAVGIALEEGSNCAAVELLDPGHSRTLLTAYGCASGALPCRLGDQTEEQVCFLDEVIEGLADDGTIIPFRLAAFAETIKDVLWGPATLRQMGGVRGVEVAFLDAVFGSSASHRKYRSHRYAARTVLGELCPGAHESLRDAARDRAQLLEVSGYAADPKRFEELLSILNHRLKLIALVDPERVRNEMGARGSKGHPHYQLSHQYLVPIIDAWAGTRKKTSFRQQAGEYLRRLFGPTG